MRFIGIDIASEKHVLAIVDEEGTVLQKPVAFTEDREGYDKLLGLAAAPEDALIVMEATGHYWQNVFVELVAAGYKVTLVNPLQTRRFAEVGLQRTKTDAIDAIGIARFGAQRKPAPTAIPDQVTQDLRELVRLRDRWMQELGDRVRQLHRVVDLTFPELTRHVRSLDSELATTVLSHWPTAAQLAKQSVRRVAATVYDGRHEIGNALAQELVTAAKTSVGKHQTYPYQVQTETLCEDIATLRRRLRSFDRQIRDALEQHEVGKLLTTIDGIGPTTAARLVAELGDITRFEHIGALAAYVGLAPGLKHSGKSAPARAGLSPLGHVRLRAKLWMPTLTAVRRNPWLRAFYERLLARGKLPMVALAASMRKLLAAVLSVAKHRRPFVPQLPAHLVENQHAPHADSAC